MQTFITNSTSNYGLDDLDFKRLNKELLECRQLLKVLLTIRDDPDAKPAWRNHPAAKMWQGYESALFSYAKMVALELKQRGIKYEVNYNAILDLISKHTISIVGDAPEWMTDPVQLDKIITTHRATLYRKDPEYYAEWKIDADWVDANHDLMVCCSRCITHWPTHVGKG